MRARKKIVLVDGSRLMRGILKRVFDRDVGLQVIAELDSFAKIPLAIQQAEVDWLILTMPPEKPIPQIVDKVLREQPELSCLVMATDGSWVRVRKIEAHETSLDQTNLDEILAILRNNELDENQTERINFKAASKNKFP